MKYKLIKNSKNDIILTIVTIKYEKNWIKYTERKQGYVCRFADGIRFKDT